MAEREKVIRDLIIQNPVPLDKLRALVSHTSNRKSILTHPQIPHPYTPLLVPPQQSRHMSCGL